MSCVSQYHFFFTCAQTVQVTVKHWVLPCKMCWRVLRSQARSWFYKQYLRSQVTTEIRTKKVTFQFLTFVVYQSMALWKERKCKMFYLLTHRYRLLDTFELKYEYSVCGIFSKMKGHCVLDVFIGEERFKNTTWHFQVFFSFGLILNSNFYNLVFG